MCNIYSIYIYICVCVLTYTCVCVCVSTPVPKVLSHQHMRISGLISQTYLPRFELLNKLSISVLCSKRLVFLAFRFVHLSVSSSQGGLHSDPSSCEQPSKCFRHRVPLRAVV